MQQQTSLGRPSTEMKITDTALHGVGVGLRAPHYREMLATLPNLAFLEVNSENFFGDGGQPLSFLERFRAHYPFSFHGVGLSLGSTDGLSARHLRKLRAIIDRFEPTLVSDHLCWGSVDDAYVNDLLPLPYTEEALAQICMNIDRAQAFLGRSILVENVSSYLEFACSEMSERDFLAAVAKRTGCGILLDINNIFVSASNHGYSATGYLDAIPQAAVKQMHLAGHERSGRLLIDTHGAPIANAVWELYADAVRRFGDVPTLIERDTHIPPLVALIGEANRARHVLRENGHGVANAAA
ncbi:MAG: DUF692 domain-containing protein [Burkholderiales bacterium]